MGDSYTRNSMRILRGGKVLLLSLRLIFSLVVLCLPTQRTTAQDEYHDGGWISYGEEFAAGRVRAASADGLVYYEIPTRFRFRAQAGDDIVISQTQDGGSELVYLAILDSGSNELWGQRAEGDSIANFCCIERDGTYIFEYFVFFGGSQLRLTRGPSSGEADQTCSLPPKLQPGIRAQNIDGSDTRMRGGPSLSHPRVGSIAPGDVVAVLNGPILADGYNWWQVRHGDDIGWAAEGGNCEYWLTPLSDVTDNCTLSPNLKAGGWGQVVPGPANRMRRGPSLSDPRVGSIEAGEVVAVLDGPVFVDGYYWWQVRHGDVTGWTAESGECEYWIVPVGNGSDGVGYLDNNNFFDDHKFYAREGDRVTITMSTISGDLGPALRLYNSAGQELAFDDDGGSGVNARLSDFRIPADGEYTIHALRLREGQAGGYELRLSWSQAAPDPTIQADSGDSDGFGYMATGRLNDDNFFDDYKFDARAGDDVMISMDVTSGDLNPAIRLYNSAGQELAFDDDSGSGVNARLSDFRIPADGEYTIHALRLYAGQSGEYELRLSGSRPPVTEAQESVPAGPIIVDGSCTLADAIIAANEDRAVGGCPVGSGADTITLTADITLKSELPPITSEITLEGGRNAISGGGIYQIFFVEEGGSLTIRKSRLINGGGNPEFQPEGFKFHSTFGGAIFSYGDLNIIDSEVSGNTAEHGGALFAFAGNLNIINSEFNSNAAERAGGAIRVWESQAAITNSLFSGNTAGWAGGAIDLLTDPATLTISNSEFVSNSAGAFGGAIESFSAVLRVKHSKFIGNSANTSGGAINRSYSTNVSVEGSTFSKNRPQDCVNVECVSVPDGGRTLAATAIEEGSPPPAAVPEGPINAGELCELADAITAANEDRVAGGCPAGSGHDTITLLRNISLSNALPPITTGISIDGAGKTISGAGAHRIFSVQQGGDLSISQLWLIDGSAEEGGAILNQRGNLTVTGSHFSGNTATSNDGGAIDSDGGSLSITNSTFSGNTSADDGGAIYFDNDDDNPLTLSRNTFTNNSGEDGGALYFDDGFGDLENNTFRGNSAGDNGGAIYFDDDDGGPLSISGNTFAENSAEDEGGAIYVRDGQGTLSDNKFEDNTPNRCAGRGLPNFSGGCGDAPEDMPEVRTWRVGARALIVHDDTDLWRDAGPLGGRNVVKRKLDAGTPIEFLDLNDPHDSHAWYLVRVLETDLIEGWIAQPIDGPDLFIESTVTISVPAVAPKDTEAEAESSTPSIALGESVEFCLVAETDRDSFQLLLTEPSFFIAVSMTAHDQNTEIMVPALTLWDSAGNELKTDKNDSEERVAQLNVSNPQPGLYTVSAWTVRGKGCYTLAAFDGGTELEVVTEGSGVSYERLKHADGNVDLSAIDDQELVAIGVIDAARFHGSGFEDGVNVCFPGFGEVMFRSEFNPATYHPWPSLRNNGKTCTRILRPGTLALVTDSDDLSALYTPLQPYYAGIADVPNLFLQLADSTLFRGAFLHCQPAVDRFKLDRLRFRSGLIESEEFVGSTTDHIARCVTGDAMGAGPNDLRESVDTLNDFLVGVEKLDAVNDFIQKHPKDATADSTLFAMFERGLITEEEYLTYLVYREEGESFVAFSLRDHLVTILETGIDALPLTDAAKQYARNSVDTLLASEEADEILENTERVINHPLFPLVISRSVTGEVRSTPKAWNDLFVVALMEVAGEDSIDAVADLLVWVPMGPGETLYLILGEGAQQYAYTRGKLKDYCRITNKARATLHVRAAPDLNSEALGALVIDRRIFSEGIVTDANEKRWHKVLVRQSPHKRGATGLASLRGSGSSSIQWLDGYIDADWVEEKGVCDDYVEPDAG